jgi:hypothetical protein
MSTLLIDRRRFLTLPIALLLAPLVPVLTPFRPVSAEPIRRRGQYSADVGVLYNLLTFHSEGTIDEFVDRSIGEYGVLIAGDGSSISTRIESRGRFGENRWMPIHSRSWFTVRGRLSQTEVAYDYARRSISYRARAETFFLRRLRVVEDVVPIPIGLHVDDVVSAILNYADGLWSPSDGALRTFVVRRRHAPDEGPDDVSSSYRAELTTLEAKVTANAADGKSSALFDLSPFSSWMRPSRPAEITFGVNRRPELITSSMILGSSVTIRLGAV